jgi:hypothetical protein
MISMANAEATLIRSLSLRESNAALRRSHAAWDRGLVEVTLIVRMVSNVYLDLVRNTHGMLQLRLHAACQVGSKGQSQETGCR